MTNRLYTGQERRTAVRFPFDAWVKVEHKEGSFEARGTDFNDDFVRIVNAEHLEEGTEVKVSVVDEVGNHVVIRGEVFRSSVKEGDDFVTMVIRRTSEPVAAQPEDGPPPQGDGKKSSSDEE